MFLKSKFYRNEKETLLHTALGGKYRNKSLLPNNKKILKVIFLKTKQNHLLLFFFMISSFLYLTEHCNFITVELNKEADFSHRHELVFLRH